MRILAISDMEHDLVKSPLIKERFGDVDFVLACGDMSIGYLEYVVTMLCKPVYFVYGNHAQRFVLDELGKVKEEPGGCINLHGKIMERNGVLIGGLEGSMRYREGDHQYSDAGMYWQVLRLLPRLWRNRLRYGRAIDILVTHAPPFGIHDAPDLCHQGFKAFLWLMRHFRPLYLVHGHIHLYRLDAQRRTQYGATTVLNAFGYQIIELDEQQLAKPRP
jgi:Icc-related predicted phosphoesterase